MEFPKILELLKVSIKRLFGLGAVCGLLLFTNDVILNKLGLKVFVNNYRTQVGLTFLICLIFVITDFAIYIGKTVNKFHRWYKNKTYGIKRLKKLTTEEKLLLKRYIDNNTRSIKFPLDNGIVNELEFYDIIYRASDIGRQVTGFPYNIQPWAWDYLNKHKKLLD
jgi:hypothetical protein